VGGQAMENWEVNNNEAFLQMLLDLDPMLWRVKKKLLETGVNPDLLPYIIDMIANVHNTTGYGTVEIVIGKGKVNTLMGHVNKQLNVDVN
jgi:hypothetical protein